MGRYISTGIVYQYCFEKKKIELDYQHEHWQQKPFSEVKDEIIGQMFPDIYDYSEDDQCIYFTLSDSISTDELISCIKTYYSFASRRKGDAKEIEEVTQLLQGKTMEEADKIAVDCPSYLFQRTKLGYDYGYYAYPLTIDGKKGFYGVNMSIIMIDMSSAKTDTEDDLLSYDFFTDLLRYRMKPEKLADAMIVFLSA